MTQHEPHTVAQHGHAPTLPDGGEDVTATDPTWHDAVTAVAEKAMTALPLSTGRIEKAVALVLAGAVELLPDGTATVGSQRHGITYNVVDGHCVCPDAAKAPEGWCKHKIASAIARQAKARLSPQQRLQEGANLAQPAEPAPSVTSQGAASDPEGQSGKGWATADLSPHDPVDVAIAQAEKVCQKAVEMTAPAYRSFLTLLPQHKRVAGTKTTPVFAPIRLPYMSVDGRIKMALDEHKAKGARLQIQTQFDTEPVSGQLLCRAMVVSELLGTATAHARAFLHGVGVDATNPLENAETSAVGRALGFLGYGLYGTGIASAEEVIQAQAARDPQGASEGTAAPEEKPASDRQRAFLRDLLERAGGVAEDIEAQLATVTTSREASALISQLREQLREEQDKS